MQEKFQLNFSYTFTTFAGVVLFVLRSRRVEGRGLIYVYYCFSPLI